MCFATLLLFPRRLTTSSTGIALTLVKGASQGEGLTLACQSQDGREIDGQVWMVTVSSALERVPGGGLVCFYVGVLVVDRGTHTGTIGTTTAPTKPLHTHIRRGLGPGQRLGAEVRG